MLKTHKIKEEYEYKSKKLKEELESLEKKYKKDLKDNNIREEKLKMDSKRAEDVFKKKEIIFRGKRIDNNEWVQGYLSGRDTIREYIKDRCVVHKIDEKTLGQFTGLFDNNGNKIFEGDILKDGDLESGIQILSGFHDQFYCVFFNQDVAQWQFRGTNYYDGRRWWELMDFPEDKEVGILIFGNIYDHLTLENNGL